MSGRPSHGSGRHDGGPEQGPLLSRRSALLEATLVAMLVAAGLAVLLTPAADAPSVADAAAVDLASPHVPSDGPTGPTEITSPSRPASPPAVAAALVPAPQPHIETDPAPSAPAGEAVRLAAPAVGIDAPVVAVGLTAAGDLAVPDPGTAGWYEPGPAPGVATDATVPAVIAGHVNSRALGPDVFASLHELTPGDQVTVTTPTGEQATFIVTEVVRYPKDEATGDRPSSSDALEPLSVSPTQPPTGDAIAPATTA